MFLNNLKQKKFFSISNFSDKISIWLFCGCVWVCATKIQVHERKQRLQVLHLLTWIDQRIFITGPSTCKANPTRKFDEWYCWLQFSVFVHVPNGPSPEVIWYPDCVCPMESLHVNRMELSVVSSPANWGLSIF